MSERAGASGTGLWAGADEADALGRHRRLLESMGDGAFRLDEDDRLAAVTDGLAETTGRTREELLGEHVSGLFGDGGAVASAVERVRAGAPGESDRLAVEARTDGDERTACDLRLASLGADEGSEDVVGILRQANEATGGDHRGRAAVAGDRERPEHRGRDLDRERYESIVEAVEDGVYVVDDESRFVMVNDSYAEMLGYDPEELLGEHVSTVVDEGTVERAKAVETKLLEEGASERVIEAELKTADGDRITAEATFALLPEGDDRAHRVGVVRDVTERVERERELERYERIVENVPVGVYRNTPGPDGEFVAANSTLASIFDADSVEEFLDHDVSDLYVDPEERAEFSETLEREGMVEEYELKQETLDGRTIWISVTAIRVEEDGETYFDGTVQDVTERKRTRQRLEEERDVFAEGPAVVFRWENEEGWPVERVSENVEDLFGYTREELESGEVPYTDLLLDEELDRIDDEVDEATASGTDRFSHDPYRVRTKDGDVRWVKDVTKIVRDEAGEITHYLGYLVDITERKEHEQELEARSAAMAESIEGMAILNEDREFAFVNQAHADIYGYDDPDAFVGESWRLCYDEAEVERLEAEVVPRLSEEGSWRGEATGLCEDGSTFPQEVSLTRLDDGQLICMVRDLTEQKERERELERFETLFTESRDVNGVLAPDGTFEYLTPSTANVLGYEPEELEGENSFDYVHPEDRERVAAAYTDLVEDPDLEPTVEYRFRHADGSWVVLESRGRNLLDDEDIGGIVVYTRDVTERTERERELERKERQFEAVFEDPNILVGLLDPDGTVVDINQTAMEYVDADLDALTGELFWETPWWGAGDGVQEDVKEWTERAAAGEYVDFEADLTKPNGERYVLEGYFRPVTNDDGDVVSVIVSDRDVTERKERERELAESERRYRTLAEYFPNGLVTLFDHDLEYTLAAGRGFEKIDPDPADLESTHFREVWDEHTADELEPLFEGTLQGTEDSVELAYAGREWEIRAVPITDERGEVFAGMTMAQDVTERKERERELTKYETIVETIDDGIYVKNDDGRFTMVNEAYAELTGYDRDELVGANASLVVDETTISESRERQTTAAEDADAAMEATIQRADGGTVPAEATFATLDRGDGRRQEIGVVRDITERKEQRRRIEESERRYRTLVENFPNGAVGLFDENLRYTAVGGELVDETGVDRDTRVGERVSDIYPDEIADQVEPHFQAALDGEADSFEIEFHDRHLYAHTLPVRNGDDEVFAGMLVVQDVTERRETQRELRESEAKFRMIAENLEEIVWMATPDADEFVYVNPTYEDVWGVDRDSLYEDSTSFIDMIHEDDRDRVREAFDALPEEPYDEEFRIRRPDGEIRWVHAQGRQVRDDDGEMVRVVGIGEDVTERVERERRLEESERRYRTLAEHIPNGAVGVFDRNLRYTLAEGAVLGETLPNAERLEGSRFPDVFPDDTAADLEPMYRAAVEEGVTDSTTTEFGGRNWQVWATPLRDADGEIFAGLSLAQDVTEQVERERELERALDLLEKTERIADVGGWEVDPDTMEVFWSDHLFDILDVPYDEQPTLEEALSVYHTEDDRAVVEDAMEEALESGDPFEVETRFETPDGEVGWIRIQGNPEVTDGEVVSLRGAIQDVTERVERERRLEDLVEELEESNERLEQFAYAASHDLQEPLRMVSSYLQLIERRYRDELDDDGREFIDFAVDGADRMRDMIDGLLKYSRVDTRGDPFEPVELSEVLEDVRADLQMSIAESDAEITADDLPRVEGDENQLRQVIQNLLDNAMEYSGDEPPRIHVSARRRAAGDRASGESGGDGVGAADGKEWLISIRDEGIGIDPEHAERVFDVFQSLHTPDEHSGTGIGLALCERIVERHGGDIWVDSEPGEGATFTFSLPAADED